MSPAIRESAAVPANESQVTVRRRGSGTLQKFMARETLTASVECSDCGYLLGMEDSIVLGRPASRARLSFPVQQPEGKTKGSHRLPD